MLGPPQYGKVLSYITGASAFPLSQISRCRLSPSLRQVFMEGKRYNTDK